MLLINSIAFICGVLYLLLDSDSWLWNIYGVYIIITLVCNIIQAYSDSKHDLKGYLYLALSIIFMLLTPLLNMLLSFSPTYQSSRSILSCAVILSLFILGGLIAAFNLFKKKSDVELLLLQIAEKHEQEPAKKKAGRTAAIIILTLVLITGLAVAYRILVINTLWETDIFISAFALFYSLLFLSAGALAIKLLHRNKIFIKILYLFITVCIFIICLLPVSSVPILIKEAEASYIHSFGEDLKAIPNFKSPDFRQVAFSIPEYFFGTVSEDYTVRRDIPFYIGTEGADTDLRLYFDAYSSSKDGDLLPGGNSILIRIHGGAWKYGDKGFMNNAQMNKYFASQGYVVFDIQYGLTTINNKKRPEKIDEHRYGEFTVDDMIRHIGKFIKYLTDNKEEFNANIDSVFISGSSAGGNLALASGLALSKGEYPDISNSRVKIKGLIPFYPANGLAHSMGIGESEVFTNPESLVDEQSPPCLIFQGKYDGLVEPAVILQMPKEYINQGNKECAILHMPYGGHSCDIYFSGYYNQTFLYYMERFMYQYR